MFRKLLQLIAILFLLLCYSKESFALEHNEIDGFANFILMIIDETKGMTSDKICILGNDEIAKSITSKRPKTTMIITNEPSQYSSCGTIYAAESQARVLKLEIAKYNKHKILTIGIFDDFNDIGGCIMVQLGRRNFELITNSKSIRESGLKLSSSLTDLIVN